MPTRPLLADLYCCAGGAALGYHRAGFEVVGIDIDHQPRYPFDFVKADVAELTPRWLQGFDAIHASPPCQHYSNLAKRNGNADDWPDLVPSTRTLLEATGRPWVIENVVGADLHDPVMLCGQMFPGLRVYRHRLFESSEDLSAPVHESHRQLCYTRDKRKAHYGRLDEMKAFVMVNGGGNSSKAAAADAMGMSPELTKHELNEAIPPAYTEYIGRQLIEAVRSNRYD